MFGILLITVVFWVFYIYSKNRKLYEAGDKFPGPRAFPILGNSLDFTTDSHRNFLIVNEFSRKYERFFRVWNNGKLYVITHSYKDAEALLNNPKELKKTDVYKFLIPWIGNGLISTSDIDTWRSHRKIITPTFHFKILQEFLEVFNRNSEILCGKLMEKVGKGPFDVCKLMKLAALDNICETAMGVEIKAQENSESEYVKAVQKVARIFSIRCFKVWLMIDFIFNLSKYSKIQEKSLKILHGATDKVIRERREMLSRGQGNPGGTSGRTSKMAFLDLLLKSEEGSKLSDRELREEVDTFMFAGHDTISSAMSFTVYCLAQHPDIQETVYKEQVDIFGDSDRAGTYSEIQEMKYLERVLKEVLRLYPSVTIMGRDLTEDFMLPGNCLVPKGAQLVLNVYALHRDPNVWPEPEKFNPDNFLPEAVQSRNPYAFIPFSAGARNCLGQKYAMLEMKACLSMITRKFKFSPSLQEEHKLRLASEVVLVSANGCHVHIESRN